MKAKHLKGKHVLLGLTKASVRGVDSVRQE